jgi:ribosomal-protein-serine acetyltransferase
MISGPEITLVKPRLDLADEVREALVESYADHIRYLLWPEPNPSIESVRNNIEQSIHNFDNHVNEYRFLILRNADSKLLGTISLLIRDLKIPYFEFGYWLSSSEQGKGYITKAVRILESYAVNELKVRRLEIRMAESNIRSKRVAERAGYEFEAKLHSDRMLPDGTIDNSLIYYKLY